MKKNVISPFLYYIHTYILLLSLRPRCTISIKNKHKNPVDKIIHHQIDQLLHRWNKSYHIFKNPPLSTRANKCIADARERSLSRIKRATPLLILVLVVTRRIIKIYPTLLNYIVKRLIILTNCYYLLINKHYYYYYNQTYEHICLINIW